MTIVKKLCYLFGASIFSFKTNVALVLKLKILVRKPSTVTYSKFLTPITGKRHVVKVSNVHFTIQYYQRPLPNAARFYPKRRTHFVW
jgi:hypothetical protein